jgi:hypothetical protein
MRMPSLLSRLRRPHRRQSHGVCKDTASMAFVFPDCPGRLKSPFEDTLASGLAVDALDVKETGELRFWADGTTLAGTCPPIACSIEEVDRRRRNNFGVVRAITEAVDPIIPPRSWTCLDGASERNG